MRPGTPRRLLLAALACAAACQPRRPGAGSEPGEEAAAPASTELVVAFIHAGARDDDGFNAAQTAGEAAVTRIRGVRVIHEDDVPEDSSALLALERAAVLRGAGLVFATALPHFDPPVLAAAQRHPQVQFLHCGGLYQEGKHPTNAGSYYAHLDEAFYVSGLVAGMTTRTGKLGFIASSAVPHVLRNINAFTLGARSVNRAVTTAVVFTGHWSDPAAEERAAEALADKKIDVLAMFVKAPATILRAAERRHIYSVGVHVDGSRFAPRGYLTGAEWRWDKIYTDYVEAARAGKPLPRVVRGGLGDGSVNISPFGPAVSGEVENQALQARAALAQGRVAIWKGPLRDNASRIVLPAGRTVVPNDVQLEMMAYLVEGVIGTLPD
jgi:basic membrane protein A